DGGRIRPELGGEIEHRPRRRGRIEGEARGGARMHCLQPVLDDAGPGGGQFGRIGGAFGKLPDSMVGHMLSFVIPAKAGISWRLAETSCPETPAFAGVTIMIRASMLPPAAAARKCGRSSRR